MPANGDAVDANDHAGRWHLLAKSGTRIPVPQLARALAPALGVVHYDLLQQLRYCGGWLGHDLGQADADRIARHLDALEIPYHRVPVAEPTIRPEVKDVRWTLPGDDGIVLDYASTLEELPLADIACADFVAFGSLVEVSPEAASAVAADVQFLKREMPSPVREQRLALLPHVASLQPTLYIVTHTARRVFRVHPGTFVPRAGASDAWPTLDRLLELVHALILALPPAAVTAETMEFWTTRRVASILISKPEEMENRLAWLCELLARGLLEAPP